MVVVHEVVVEGVLRGVFGVLSEDASHIVGGTPSPHSSVHAGNVVQDERLSRGTKNNPSIGTKKKRKQTSKENVQIQDKD